jgi:hypothetical protein
MLEERDIERHDLVSAHGLLPCDRARFCNSSLKGMSYIRESRRMLLQTSHKDGLLP